MAKSSGSVFSETLQTITNTKLEELTKQRTAFEEQYAEVLAAAKAETNTLKRVVLLVEGAKSCLDVKVEGSAGMDGRLGRVIRGGTRNTRLEKDLINLDRFLEQARFDTSISAKVLETWERTLLQHLSVQSNRLQYADLYGKLINEWLSPENSLPNSSDVEMSESFEKLPGAKRLAARAQWEEMVFEPAGTNLPALEAYLDQLFILDKKDTAAAIDDLRKGVADFEKDLNTSSHFTVGILRSTIESLENSDLLSNEKREALKDFLSNDVILTEIADILNVRMVALDRWSWGDYVTLEQRKKLNGEFSIHFDPDLLQAVFLHYIGNKWSVFFKKSFKTIRDHAAWQSSQTKISKLDRMRRQYFLGDEGATTHGSLEHKRNQTHRNQYFAFQLLDLETQQFSMNDGEEEAAYGEYAAKSRICDTGDKAVKKRKSMPVATQSARASAMAMARKSTMHHSRAESWDDAEPWAGIDNEDADDNDVGIDQLVKRPMEAKQNLLHLVSTEIITNTRIHGELTCFRTVFESWNPLLPHDTILSVLQFFGVGPTWSKFFLKFLQAPLKFVDDDSEPRLRRRGTPGSHSLSDVLGEIVLFCLDFSINEATGGALSHRLFDDVWFWNKDYDKCTKAWSSIVEFAKVTGVNVSLLYIWTNKKTGSVRICRDSDLTPDDSLPKGEIRWGFLHLDPSSGRFEIDQKMVNGHVDELRKQLQGKSKSVIDYVQAWNSYAATFLSSNFGKSSNCFGREHVDEMLATHRHIQESIFPNGSVVEHIKTMIEERFNVTDIPEGFLFFPVELGGLDLKSPFVDLLQIRDSVTDDPRSLIDQFIEKEESDYVTAQRAFDKGYVNRARTKAEDPNWKPADADVFFSFAEYTKYREQYRSTGTANMRNTYAELLKHPKERYIQATFPVLYALQSLEGQPNLRGISASWTSMDAYWRWVAQMYGPEMTDKFGGLNVVDFGLLPIGMVSMFRQRRTKWQG